MEQENGLQRIRARLRFLQIINKHVGGALGLIDLSLFDEEWSTAGYLSRDSHLLFGMLKEPMWNKAISSTRGVGSTNFYVHLRRPMAWALRKTRGRVDKNLSKLLFSQFFRQVFGKQPLKYLRTHDRIYTTKFVGEDATDAGGPYRESWEEYAQELMSRSLPLFLPCANESDTAAQNRDRWVPNPGATSDDEIEAFEFLGQVFGMAIRNKLCLPLQFASMVWKPLVNDTPTIEDIRLIDQRTLQILGMVRDWSEEDDFSTTGLNFDVTSLDGRRVDLIPGGSSIPVTYDTRLRYCELLEQFRIHEFDRQIQAIRRGLATIVPVGLLCLFTWRELEIFVCGTPTMDVALLRKNTTLNGWSSSDPTISFFWEMLES